MRIAKAPSRISFAGGGTDISPYCDHYGGCCLAVTIDRYGTATWGIQNEAPDQLTGAITDTLRATDHLYLHSPLPAMAGLGGSAALTVAGIKAIEPYTSGLDLASSAFHIERRVLGVLGGYQDQVAAALGGMLWMEFSGPAQATAVRLAAPSALANLLFLVYLGPRRRSGSDVLREQIERPNMEALSASKRLARQMRDLLLADDWPGFGEALEESWQVKRQFSALISNPSIDDFHDAARRAGAMAFKLCGAGGGGYSLVMAHPAHVDQLRSFVQEHGGAAVQFSAEGAQIVQNNGPAWARREERREQHHGWMG